MTPITDYIENADYPRRTNAAKSLGVTLTQLKRYEQMRAVVIDGVVYRPASKVKFTESK